MFYSKTTNGFYLKAEDGPDDVVEISDEFHAELLAGQSNGGIIAPDSNGQPVLSDPPPPSTASLASKKRGELEDGRKAAEADGVVMNGIRYSGDPSNRQALREALAFAAEAGITTFPTWKDSDQGFHVDHPVADVSQALLEIATNRSALIAHEGVLVGTVNAAEQADDRAAIQAVEWTTPTGEG